ncbi:MAG: helix-turn-helix domain-containing protein, partial [Pyrinomonadaceae bacterium]
MSQTLGEKLRQAREQRGISISEVAEQTRISALYLESIENNDYRPLPGGIFNKGFVKSYAKFIGVDEHEALSDYARMAAETEAVSEQPLKVYRPEVLTDDNSASSMAPTLIFAGIILAIMTGGILFVLNYIQNRDGSTANTSSNTSNTAANALGSNIANTVVPAGNAPSMATLKVEFRAATDPISLTSITDGKSASTLVAAGSSVTFEPKESLRLSYYKSLAQAARLLINGKPIILPEVPENPRRNAIEIDINKDNLAR